MAPGRKSNCANSTSCPSTARENSGTEPFLSRSEPAALERGLHPLHRLDEGRGRVRGQLALEGGVRGLTDGSALLAQVRRRELRQQRLERHPRLKSGLAGAA